MVAVDTDEDLESMMTRTQTESGLGHRSLEPSDHRHGDAQPVQPLPSVRVALELSVQHQCPLFFSGTFLCCTRNLRIGFRSCFYCGTTWTDRRIELRDSGSVELDCLGYGNLSGSVYDASDLEPKWNSIMLKTASSSDTWWWRESELELCSLNSRNLTLHRQSVHDAYAAEACLPDGGSACGWWAWPPRTIRRLNMRF